MDYKELCEVKDMLEKIIVIIGKTDYGWEVIRDYMLGQGYMNEDMVLDTENDCISNESRERIALDYIREKLDL